MKQPNLIEILIAAGYLTVDENNVWTMEIPAQKLLDLYNNAKSIIEENMNKGGNK